MAARRLFVAVPIPEEIRQVLASYSRHTGNPDIRWIPPENLHITVLFIGNVQEEEMPEIKRKLATITEIPAFQLHCEAITVVKKRGKAVMIWVRFKENAPFVRLATEIANVLALTANHHPLPHITLARVKQGKPVKIDDTIFPPVSDLLFPVNTFGLWESSLQPAGAVYTILEEWLLSQET